MKPICLILIILVSCSSSAQLKRLDNKIFTASRTNTLYTIKDSVLFNGVGSLETEKLRIQVEKFFGNWKTSEFEVTGKVCPIVDSAGSCLSDFSGFIIFKGVNKNNRLVDTTVLTIGGLGMSPNFSFSVKLKENERIYIYSPRYYLDEYDIRRK
jgi:hypothetical protein